MEHLLEVTVAWALAFFVCLSSLLGLVLLRQHLARVVWEADDEPKKRKWAKRGHHVVDVGVTTAQMGISVVGAVLIFWLLVPFVNGFGVFPAFVFVVVTFIRAIERETVTVIEDLRSMCVRVDYADAEALAK